MLFWMSWSVGPQCLTWSVLLVNGEPTLFVSCVVEVVGEDMDRDHAPLKSQVSRRIFVAGAEGY